MEQFEVKPIIPLHIGGFDVSFTNQSLMMCVVVLAVAGFMTFAVSNRRVVPTRMQSMAELAYEFVANMINSTAGEDGLRFFPLIFTIFLFVATSNYFGLVPVFFTVTSQIIVTFALTAL